MRGCLAEDELLELTRGGVLGDAPEAEAHLADCAACSSLLVALVGADPARRASLVGRTLGPYQLEAQLGAGGMGVVYRARDTRLGRTVAVKVLPPRAVASEELERRLAVEARAAAAITHPNVVRLYDVGSADGVSYLVEELVEGETLRSRLARGPLDAAEVRRLALELARGLAAAHAASVVHRDLKPDNLLLTSDGTLKILDFGLARLEAAGDPAATGPGVVRGTVGYMAPEQARGEPGDARVDLFAAGVILFELATGRRAFDGASHAERLSAVLRDTPRLDALGALAPIVARCLEKDPRRRFQSAADLAWLLEQPAAAPPAPRAALPRRVFLAGAAATGALGVVAGRWLARPAEPATAPGFRQLTYRHGRLLSARFTVDGGSILYAAAWDGDPLTAFLLRLDGGVARALELPPADVLAVSSRGEVAVALERGSLEGQALVGRLARVPVGGGAPRALLDDVSEADFTPDGAALAISRRDARGFHLELPAGHALRDAPGWIGQPRVSPDGARVACLAHPSVYDDGGDLVVVERDGRARTLAAGYSSVAGLAWDPAGDRLWTAAAREGANCAVRTVGLDGHERVVAQVTGRLRLHDVARDRRVAVSTDVWRTRAVVGRAAGPETELSMSQFSMVADLSDDGRVALGGELGADEASSGVYLRPLDGRPLHLGPGRPLALSPSGALAAAEPPDGGLVVYRAGSGAQPTATLGPIAAVSSARFIDERRLVLSAAEAGHKPRLWLVALDGAAPVALTGEGRAGRCELDAARRHAAFIDAAGGLAVVDLATLELHAVPGDLSGHRVAGWLADGRVVVRSRATPVRIVAVDPKTGATTPRGDVAPPPSGLKGVDTFICRGDVHAYSYGQELSQLFIMSASRMTRS